MIRLKAVEHIKSFGDFKLDGLWIKSFHFESTPLNGAKKRLTVELIPFAYMEDGSKLFDYERPKKLYIGDAQTYLEENIGSNFFNAYFATELAISDIMNEQYPDWNCEFEPPAI